MRRGFTLLELIIVVIIIGILVSLAIPRFIGTMERTRAGEAIQILGALRSANERFAAQNDGDYNTDGACAGLDVSFTPLKHFSTPVCTDATNGIITMTRGVSGAGYSLQTSAAGCLSCTEILGNLSCTEAGVAVFPLCN